MFLCIGGRDIYKKISDFILVDFRMILRFGIKSEAIDEYKNQTWGKLFLEKF